MEPHVNDLQRQVLNYLKSSGGATTEEVSIGTGLYAYTAAPRITELRKLGIVLDSGDRRKTSRGKNAIVWKA